MLARLRILAALALLTLTLAPTTPAAAQDAAPADQDAAPADQDAAPADEGATVGEVKAKEQLRTLADVATFPIVTAQRVSDVVEIAIVNKDLQVKSSLEPIEQAVVRAPGLSGITRVSIPSDAEGPNTRLTIDNVDFASPHAIAIHTSVSRVAGRVMLTQEWSRLDDETHTVQLIQSGGEHHPEGEPRVLLYVQITAAPPVDLRLSAENVVELRRRFPAEVAKYVDPIFLTLRQEGSLARVDPKLAWQVFSDAFTPSPELMQKVNALVRKLDAENFHEREAASRELEKFDQPAALALMRVDRSTLSEEQRGRIDAFLATYRTVPDADAQRLRSDPDFLLDCLYSEEEPIRQQALAELTKLVGRPIEFDFTADPAVRLAAITRLRSEFGATPATTKRVKL